MIPLNQLTALIVKAVPEIMELKFGCKVEIDTREGSIVGTYWMTENPLWGSGIEYLKILCHTDTVNHTIVSWLRSDLKILGRDIQLADVLRAFHAKVDSYTMTENFASDILFRGWNLSVPLHLQSKETIQFLLEIIK